VNRVDDDGEVRIYCDFPKCGKRAIYVAGANERQLDVCEKHKPLADFIVELIKLRFM
jgi:hypothetical protein